MPKVVRITIEFTEGGGISIQHPNDPVLCFGLIEIAKIQIAKKLLSTSDENDRKIIQLPTGTQLKDA